MEFKSTEEIRAHLSKPENIHTTKLFIVRWNGSVPTIAPDRLGLLDDPGFLEVILKEHMRRRKVGVVPDEEENVGGEDR